MNNTAARPEQLEEQKKRELLARMTEDVRQQYREAMALNEIIAFMKEMLGPAEDERRITLSDMGVCGLRHILEDMEKRADSIACGGIFPYQLEEVAGMKLEGGNE